MNSKKTYKCPSECPYSDPSGNHLCRPGLVLRYRNLFSIYIDPLELLLWGLVFFLPIGMSVRDAWDDNLSFDDALKRIGALASLAVIIRTGPTNAIYEKLMKTDLARFLNRKN